MNCFTIHNGSRVQLAISLNDRWRHSRGAREFIERSSYWWCAVSNTKGSIALFAVENQVIRQRQLTGSRVKNRPGLPINGRIFVLRIRVSVFGVAAAVKTARQPKGRSHGKTY